jgi:hypothetical protein
MDSLNLTNEEFDFVFDGVAYRVKKANLQQVILLQKRLADVNDTGAIGMLQTVAYAIYLILNSVDKNITEEYVLERCPGSFDAVDFLIQLGFSYQQKKD